MIDKKVAKVANLVYNVLDKHKDTDENLCVIEDILVDDKGNCIHITIVGWIYTKTIQEIGNVFGDKNPAITTNNDHVQLVIINNKYKDIIDE